MTNDYAEGYEHGWVASREDIRNYLKKRLHRLRMGYDTPTLREVLEEMERIINNG